MPCEARNGWATARLLNDVLAGLAGTAAGVIKSKPGSEGEFAWTFRQEGSPPQVALRSKWETGRRFELARLLGDNIFFARMPNGPEPLSPATRVV